MIRAASWVTAALLCLAGVVGIIIATPAQARASTGYRYWAYYLGHGSSWQYAQRGPASEYPADGDVEGWRFAIQVDAAGGLAPRDVPNFAALCASTPAKAGDIRVGLVIDFGVAGDAPAHETPPTGVLPGCVYVHNGESGAAVLQAAATVRIGTGHDAGLVCGIGGYPKSECAVAVAVTPGSTATSKPRPTSTPVAARTPVTASTDRPTPSSSPLSPADSEPAAGGTSGSGEAVPASAAAASSSGWIRLRNNDSDRIEFTAIVGGALVVVLGAAAIWRTRRGRP